MRRRGDFLLALVLAVALHGLVAVAVNHLVPAGSRPPALVPAGELVLDVAFETPVQVAAPALTRAAETPEVVTPAPPPAPPETPPVPVRAARLLTAADSVAAAATPRSEEVATSAPAVVAQTLPLAPSGPGTAESEGMRPATPQAAAAAEPLAVAGIRPRYPLSARRRGQEGTTTVRARVDTAGRCVHAEVLRSSGVEALDRAAREAVQAARFVPARRDGQPVPGECVLTFVFRLED